MTGGVDMSAKISRRCGRRSPFRPPGPAWRPANWRRGRAPGPAVQRHRRSDSNQSTASRHLGILRASGVVDCRREGTWVYYRITEQEHATVAKALAMREAELAGRDRRGARPNAPLGPAPKCRSGACTALQWGHRGPRGLHRLAPRLR